MDFVVASTVLDSNVQQNRLIVSTSDFRLLVFAVNDKVPLVMEMLLESNHPSAGLCLTIAVSPTIDLLALGFVGDLQVFQLTEVPIRAFTLLHHLRAPFRHEPIAGIFFVDLPKNKKSLVFFAYERQHAQLSLDNFKLSCSAVDGSPECKTQAMCKGRTMLFSLEDGYLNRYEI